MLRVSDYLMIAAAILWMMLVPTASYAERIILRNLRSVEKSVVAFDADGVRFDDASELGWDEIKAGNVKPADQRQFDQYLQMLGEDLYRVRVRLLNEDYKDLGASAEKLYPVYVNRQSKTAYMVFQAVMWARLAEGQRASAVAPYLRCYAYLRDNKKLSESIPGNRQLKFDPVTAMTPEILPIWFDKANATTALTELSETIRTLSKPVPPGARIYYGTMAIAAGQIETGERVLASLGQPSGSLGQWMMVAGAYSESERGGDNQTIMSLHANLSSMSPTIQPLASYLIGCDQLRRGSDKQDEGILTLLSVVAVHGENYPELAAASIAAAIDSAQTRNDSNSRHMASVLRKELLRTFPTSHHAQALTQSIHVSSDEP